MKKISGKKIKLVLFHMGAFLVIALCFLKFPEEVIELKNQVRVMMNPDLRDLEIDFSKYPVMEHKSDAWYLKERLIYHAGGEIGGLNYTNSEEAMEKTLELGARYIEIDFLYTSDQKLACAHYWDSLWSGEEAPTLAEYEDLLIFGKYSAMTIEELLAYMEQYPDLHIIVDTKEEDYERVVRDLVQLSAFNTEITDRFIIQLYQAGEKAQFQKIYPFKDENFLLTTYKMNSEHTNRIMKICYDENISVIAVPSEAVNDELIVQFQEKNIIIYEYTVNRPNSAQKSLDKGIHGFYTDCLRIEDLQFE